MRTHDTGKMNHILEDIPVFFPIVLFSFTPNSSLSLRRQALQCTCYGTQREKKIRDRKTLVIAENRIADPDGWSDNVEGLKNPLSATMYGQAMFRPNVKIIFLQSWGSVTRFLLGSGSVYFRQNSDFFPFKNCLSTVPT
jgi:hypothetical protein